MTTLSPHISINLNHHHSTCIIDPNLALSSYGLTLTKNLANFLELWIAREFWQILDNINYYKQHPESLQLKTSVPTTNQQELIQTLQNWQSLRIATVPTNLNLFWIGDNKSESFLPSNVDPQLIYHWESLAHSLDNQLEQHSVTQSTITSAFRDTVALAAALKSAFILTYQSPTKQDKNLPPDICSALESWGISCQQIDSNDSIAAIEREKLLHLIIQAGLSKFLWAGLNLVVLHLVVPSPSHLPYGASEIQETQSSNMQTYIEEFPLTPNFWKKARGFWYRVKM
ncbi:MAG: hypothetical protein F6K18_04605 [Okeania sp. SIO2C2]|uniref:hypothetical protein n=1 Tax=Okeania sp. SIO2C2 TaxID=2607787 RepID=UPI0013B674A4|nr:hypothetical protein [Okeania sp. SIO2C2]NEP86155.1 hypothetical protein [Okeania sp. SIO2C2]